MNSSRFDRRKSRSNEKNTNQKIASIAVQNAGEYIAHPLTILANWHFTRRQIKCTVKKVRGQLWAVEQPAGLVVGFIQDLSQNTMHTAHL